MILNVLLLALGMLLHGAAAIILVVPIVLPLIHLLRPCRWAWWSSSTADADGNAGAADMPDRDRD